MNGHCLRPRKLGWLGSAHPRPGGRRLRSCPLKRIALTFLLAAIVLELRARPQSLGFANLVARHGRRITEADWMRAAPSTLRRARSDFRIACESELREAQAQADSALPLSHDLASPVSMGEDEGIASLRRRIAEARGQDRRSYVSEILHLQVLHEFQERGIALAPSFAVGHALVQFTEVSPKQLVAGVYSEDALELLRGHINGILGEWDHLTRDFVLKVSLFQVGQMYSISALFGYALRRAHQRYELEQLASSQAMGAPRSLAEYVAAFTDEAMDRVTGVASWEAEAALERQLALLFGNVAALREEVERALAPTLKARGNPRAPEAEERMRKAVLQDEVASLRLSIRNLRQLAFEGCAFGNFLSEAETRAASMYDFKPSTGGDLSLPLGGVDDAAALSSFRILGV